MRKSRIIFWTILAASVISLAAAFTVSRSTDTDLIAKRMSASVSASLKRLDLFAERAVTQDRSQWLDLKDLPKDMVIYRYVNDSLQSWENQFPLKNDNISSKDYFHVLANPKSNINSPLKEVGCELGFFNFGSYWFLCKSVLSEDGVAKVIAGLRLKGNVAPLSSSEGSPVVVDGTPLFKVTGESYGQVYMVNIGLLHLALGLFLVLCLMLLNSRKTMRRFFFCLLAMSAAIVGMYFWGRQVVTQYDLYSPILYASGNYFYSLGAVILVDLFIVVGCVSLNIMKDTILELADTRKKKLLLSSLIYVAIAVIVAYVHLSLCSILNNSNICLELYKPDQLSRYSAIVYVSRIAVLLCIPSLIQFLGVDAFSRRWRVIMSSVIALYLVIVSSVLGFKKEHNKIEVWANRLAVERDVSLELRLRAAENGIASDVIVSALSMLENMEPAILNRVVELHFGLEPQDYEMYAKVFNASQNSQQDISFFNERIAGATAIVGDSRFLFKSTSSGQVEYTGIFQYFNEKNGLSTVLVCLDRRMSGAYRGYESLMDMYPSSKVNIPAIYSYAKYSGSDIQVFRGDYPYTTSMTSETYDDVYEKEARTLTSDGYLHFVNVVAPGEAVIISRRIQGFYYYLIETVFLFALAFSLLELFVIGVRRQKRNKLKNAGRYKTRINVLLMSSLTLTLAVLMTVSVTFVYRRNEENMHRIMVDKLNSIQSIVQSSVSSANYSLETIREMTGSDVVIFSADGRLMMSTSPQFFESSESGSRVDGKAYKELVYNAKRYFLKKDKINGTRYYNMYAPILDRDSKMMAILCSPYVEDAYDFENDAIIHLMSIISVFIILLIVARFMASAVLERMFKPLEEMGRKMSKADLSTLDYIEYNQNDEIKTLVDAYNRMVNELSENTKKLALAERDHAWSGMARQVAHEIKNPLTPMKLQIQRLIRLRAKNDPSWQSKFDEVSELLLDHIDILSNTANEFSTFAKLYTEEPTEFNLDQVLQEEITMFDNRENVKFDYRGLDGAVVVGPKPQLTRVFVNLINNAVQAVEELRDGRIIVSLRNSTKDGYYDIVIEDNGPGVSKENEEKLFTPNFTTKNSGSGLGLAISRSILEKCEATIFYSKSFSLGGACFCVAYPKK